MAFDVGEIQKQVTLMVGHDGLNSKVITWTNRVLMTIVGKAYWQSQVKRIQVQPVTGTTTVSSNWITSSLTAQDIINVYRVEQAQMATTANTVGTYVNVLQHCALDGLYGHYYGLNASTSASTMEQYAVVGWGVTTSGTFTTSNYMYPSLAVYPNANATGTQTPGHLLVHALVAPTVVSGTGDTNWIIQKYFDVVLAGVLRLARLYVGDAQGYILEKTEFENGIRDMLTNEESYMAQTPTLRGITPETLGRF